MPQQTWLGALVPTGLPISTLFPNDSGHPLWPVGQVSLLAGSSGVGKTTLLYQLLSRWQSLETFGGFAGPDGPYGLIAADRTIDAHKETAAMVNLSWSSMVVRSLVDDTGIDLNQLELNPLSLLFNLLANIRHELPGGPALIIVDPLMIFLGVDLNKYHLVASRLIKLNRWCQAANVLLIGTHHATKPRTDWSFKRPQDRLAGSGALLAFTSTQGFLAGADELEDATWSEWTTVSHHHPAVTLRLVRNETGLFEVAGVGDQKNTGPEAGPSGPSLALSASAQGLLDQMPDDAVMSRRQLAKLTSASRTGDRALAELSDKGMVIKVAHGLYKKAANH